jgi:hypothetical protein
VIDLLSSRLHLYVLIIFICYNLKSLRRAEINAISGATEFSEFYKRLKDIKDYHRRYPNEVVEPLELQFMREEKKREEDGGKKNSITRECNRSSF